MIKSGVALKIALAQNGQELMTTNLLGLQRDMLLLEAGVQVNVSASIELDVVSAQALFDYLFEHEGDARAKPVSHLQDVLYDMGFRPSEWLGNE